MKTMKFTIVAALAAIVAMTASAATAAEGYGEEKKSNKTIAETAIEAGQFETLVAALKAADLVDMVSGDEEYTVFAPTDKAFKALPEGTVETLLKPENKKLLQTVLAYHVVPGDVSAKKVMGMKAGKTASGQQVDIKTEDGKVMIDKATVVKADIVCSNGRIHVIDKVLMPATETIPMVAEKAGSFSTLLAAVNAAGLSETLSGEGPFTVFAPTDEAFAKLPQGTVQTLLKPENKSKLANILKYHVVEGRVYSSDALKAGSAPTLEGESIKISKQGGKAMVNGAKLVKTDIDASNGVIHVVDSVLMPGNE